MVESGEKSGRNARQRKHRLTESSQQSNQDKDMDEDHECNDLVNSDEDDFDPKRGGSDQSQESQRDEDESYGPKKKTQKSKAKGKKTRNEPLEEGALSDNDSAVKQTKT